MTEVSQPAFVSAYTGNKLHHGMRKVYKGEGGVLCFPLRKVSACGMDGANVVPFQRIGYLIFLSFSLSASVWISISFVVYQK